MKTAAVVFERPGEVRIRNLPLPQIAPDEVGIRTAYSGVSQGTERWVLTGRYGHWDRDCSAFYPCCPGYQAAGIIDAVGSEVTDLMVGDRVIAPSGRFADLNIRYPGPCIASHSAYLVVARSKVTRVPPSVDLATASLYQMAAQSNHGVRLAGVKQGEVVVVIGLGMIGQMSSQAARRAGARVIATDVVASRVQAAARYSADRVVDATTGVLEEALLEEAPDGADVVIDTTGDSGMFGRCVDLIRREGRIALQGYYPDLIEVDFQPTHRKRATVAFACGWDAEHNDRLMADMESGAVEIGPLITHRVPFDEAEAAYRMIVGHPTDSLGLVIEWNESLT